MKIRLNNKKFGISFELPTNTSREEANKAKSAITAIISRVLLQGGKLSYDNPQIVNFVRLSAQDYTTNPDVVSTDMQNLEALFVVGDLEGPLVEETMRKHTGQMYGFSSIGNKSTTSALTYAEDVCTEKFDQRYPPYIMMVEAILKRH